MRLIIASRNVHKIREIRSILKKNLPGWDLASLIDFPKYTPPPEEGKSFLENAILKARHAAKTLECLALADDSGLVVPALDGLPGIQSACFAGDEASDKDNRKKLLLAMRDFKDHKRLAYFECALALATPEGIKKTASALCEGEITEEERGSQGFGYDSLFVKHEYNRTFGELEEELKNRISHRRKALDKMQIVFESFK